MDVKLQSNYTQLFTANSTNTLILPHDLDLHGYEMLVAGSTFEDMSRPPRIDLRL